MAELIDRKEIFFTYSKKDKEEYGGDFAGGVLFALDKIDEMPTIEAKPVVHAHWVTDFDFDPEEEQELYFYFCSKCKNELFGDKENFKYCPYCGAQMDEEVSE